MIDFNLLVVPVSPSASCGPDLDLEGDAAYLNFLVGAEQALPKSYFENTTSSGEVKRFDSSSIDAEAYFASAAPILARTHDLRLIVLLAKISILSRDLASFTTCIRAIAALLQTQWKSVHPQGEDGDFSYRAVAIEAIESLPTVIFPLHFYPLITDRRYGAVTYRALLVAAGELKPAEGEEVVEAGLIDRMADDVDLTTLKAATASFLDLKDAVTSVSTVWSAATDSPGNLSFDRLVATLNGICGWLQKTVTRRDPSAAPQMVEVDAAGDSDVDQASPSTTPLSGAVRIDSAGAAAAALKAAALYLSTKEPSSPALLLVRQAQQMVGKSFVEIMRMMVPKHMDAAAINIGRDRFFDLPIERMAAMDDEMSAITVPEADDQTIEHVAESRAQALMLLERVAAFFRAAEPSSPIPFLLDKARDLAQRDFIAVLRDVLPDDALGGLLTKEA